VEKNTIQRTITTQNNPFATRSSGVGFFRSVVSAFCMIVAYCFQSFLTPPENDGQSAKRMISIIRLMNVFAI
jgi:hypothetical protein